MGFIFTIIGTMLALDAIWWWLLARLLNRKRCRIALGMFMCAQMIGLTWIISSRLLHADWDRCLPKFAVSAIFIWHFIVLGLLVLAAAVLFPILLVKTIVRWCKQDRPWLRPPQREPHAWSRREFLRATAALAPPLFTLSLTGIALGQLNHFRVRRFVLPMRDLPRDLDGVTIAHVSDMHVGRFTSGKVLRRLVDAVNELRADLVLITGDLINDALADLDHGIELVRAMEGRFGLYIIEGNHDLIEDGAEFERRVRLSGIPFLLDQSAIVEVRGTPVQLLGLSWTRVRENRDVAIAQSVHALLQQRRADLFPILLAHHPHAFDAAAEANLPLTLSGHTHGGQLMLNDQIGGGPAIFRYWSGLYTRGESQMIVSNGVGNWFPLRVNAPAELLHLTLRRES
ncbi:MAG TPA: metallophosphoesterase [Chthoniobacterales bacterium]|nr:metallophosphoesterase [Chthoniobacterales bacterium]